MVKRL